MGQTSTHQGIRMSEKIALGTKIASQVSCTLRVAREETVACGLRCLQISSSSLQEKFTATLASCQFAHACRFQPHAKQSGLALQTHAGAIISRGLEHLLVLHVDI